MKNTEWEDSPASLGVKATYNMLTNKTDSNSGDIMVNVMMMPWSVFSTEVEQYSDVLFSDISKAANKGSQLVKNQDLSKKLSEISEEYGNIPSALNYETGYGGGWWNGLYNLAYPDNQQPYEFNPNL